MADVFGPFATSGNTWSDGEWSRFAPTWAPSGPILAAGASVPASATTGEWAFASSGLNVSAGTGRAWVRGFGITRTGTPTTHATTANTHATWSRRDRLVLRRDLTAGTVTTAVKIGTAAASPVAPSLTQTETGVWEETLFSYLTPPNSGTSITGVIDEREWVRPDGQGYVAPQDLTANTLWISGGGDVSATAPSPSLMIGDPSAFNVVVDGNEISGRNNGVYSPVFIESGATVPNDTITGTSSVANKNYVDSGRRFMRAQRNVNNDAFPNNAWTAFGSDTDWTETDPHGMRTTGATLVAPWDGWYDIDATIHWASNSTGSRGVALQPAGGVNIGEGAGQILYLGYVQASGATVLSGSHKTFLAAGNTVQVAGFQNSGGTLTINSVRFSVAYLGTNA